MISKFRILLFVIIPFVCLYLSGFSQQENKITYFNSTGFAYLQGFGYLRSMTGFTTDNDASNWAVITVNGIKYHSSVIGLGIGYEQWHDSYTLPAFVRYQVFFKDIKPDVFQYIDLGYAFGSPKKEENGLSEKGNFLFSAGLGLNIKVDTKAHITISAFYKLQQTHVTSYKTDNKYNYNFFGASLGIMFY